MAREEQQASSGTGRRDGVCGVQLERRRKRVSQAHPATEAPYKEGYRAGPLGTQLRNEYLHERGTQFELRNKDGCIRLRRRCRFCGGARGAAVRVLDLEAEDIPRRRSGSDTDTSRDAQPGGGVHSRAPRSCEFTIDGENSTSSGSFASRWRQTVACSDDGPATLDETPRATPNEEDHRHRGQAGHRRRLGGRLHHRQDHAVIDAGGAVGTADRTVVITVKTLPKPAR